jgi:hypothetical protein
MQEEVIQEVLQQVDRERLIELACNVANITSITGEEEGTKSFLEPLASRNQLLVNAPIIPHAGL